MNGRRGALIERFRHIARERSGALRAALSSATAPAPELWTERLGALHTTKGEARMLGMTALAEVAHALEERLHGSGASWPPPEHERLSAALAIFEAMLGPALDAGELERERARALDALAGRAHEGHDDDVSPAPREPRPFAPQHERLIRVQAASIDQVCDGLDELRADLARLAARRESVAREAIDELRGRVERLAAAASELRLGPIEPVLSALAQHAVELATQQGKRLNVAVDAAGSELERTILDRISEPLLHLVRNAVDHGVLAEREGTVTLVASARAASVIIVVEDDGPGIDVARLRDVALARGVIDERAARVLSDEAALELVFRPHVSTRAQASEVSGRGLGLDVVRRVIESIGGRVDVERRPECGTRFLIEVPTRLTREATLVVTSGPVLVGVPSRYVVQVVETAGAVEPVAGGHAIRVNGELLPLRDLNGAMGFDAPETTPIALIVEIGEQRWALTASGLVGEQEVLRRPADRPLAAFAFAGASAVLDDGRPVLLPAVAELIRRAGAQGVRTARAAPSPQRKTLRAVVVDDSPIAREIVAEIVTAAGLDVSQAVDGQAALELLEQRPVDLIVTDVEMPRIDGFELTRRVRARGLRVPVVVVTTRGSIEDRRRAAECGADAYVVKTEFRDAELLETVRGLMGVRR